MAGSCCLELTVHLFSWVSISRFGPRVERSLPPFRAHESEGFHHPGDLVTSHQTSLRASHLSCPLNPHHSQPNGGHVSHVRWHQNLPSPRAFPVTASNLHRITNLTFAPTQKPFPRRSLLKTLPRLLADGGGLPELGAIRRILDLGSELSLLG